MSSAAESGSGGRSENRLAGEISPYLLLHAHNPVDWYPWGEEALGKARDEDKPIFLSVGYSTCYWCHVMERESFSDAGVASLMNQAFVNVKVDREERPEIDEIYMAATQIFTHQGGWPNSVFLTPDLKPFFAGTYFPPQDMHGRPSFKTVLLSMQNAWETRRDDVRQQAEEMSAAMQRFLEERGEPSDRVASADVAEQSKRALMGRYDAEWGGFGGAPKFPSPANLYLLMELAEDGEGASDARSADMLEGTLDHMARGGIYDQLAGGFHRYATDREWKIPHFEKMLYDNGHLLELYARDHARTGDEDRARVVRETVAFLERELRDPVGGFWSAIDAEIDGREGAHHVWTHGELIEVLGEEDASFLASVLGFAGDPFFEGEHYVLHLPRSYDEQARRRQLSRDQLLAQVEPMKAKLLEARRRRKMPLVDDKVLTDWNGMAISGLATAGHLLDDAHMIELAAQAAEFVLEHLRSEDGRLLHSWRRGSEGEEGEARYDALLSDYVFFVRGLLALHDASGDDRWLAEAKRLTKEQMERLEDPRGGFYTAGAQPDVLFRSKEVFDGALPAANAVAALNLLTLASKEGPDPWLPRAEKTLKAFTGFAERQPEGARMMTLAVRRYHRLAGGPIGPEAEVEATVMNLAEKAARKLVRAELSVPESSSESLAEDDGWCPFTLELTIQDGWHVYAHGVRSGRGVEPTQLDGVGTELRDVRWPEPTQWSGGDETVDVYEGTVVVRGELRADAEPALRLRVQPCDDRRCLAPVAIPVAIDA